MLFEVQQLLRNPFSIGDNRQTVNLQQGEYASRIWRWLWLLLLLPLIASAWARGWWAPDEPRYAEVAREAFQEGHWLVLHLCGEIYPDKPPLLYWIAGVLGVLSDWTPGVMRLVSLAAALGSGCLVARIARRWWGGLEASVAPVFLLGTVMWMDLGGRLQIDPLLAFFTTLAIELGERPARDSGSKGHHVLLAGLAAGFGGLAKGPVAWLSIGLILMSWLLVQVREPGPKASRSALVGSIVLALLPVGLWAAAAIASEPALARQLLFDQHVGRNVGTVPHAGPPWKYLFRLPLFLLPWTPLVLAGLAAGWRALRKGAPRSIQERGLARATLWFLVLLVVFSLMPPKRDLYLLSAYPAASLLAARWVAQRLRNSSGRHWFFSVPGALLLMAGSAALFGSLFVSKAEALEGIAGIRIRLLSVGIALVGLGFCAWKASRSNDLLRAFRTGFITWSLAGAVAVLALFPAIDSVKSPRSLAERIALLPNLPPRIPCRGVKPEGYRFYSGLPFVSSKDILEDLRSLESEGLPIFALVRQKDWKKLSQDARDSYSILFAQDVGSRHVFAIGRGFDSSSGQKSHSTL